MPNINRELRHIAAFKELMKFEVNLVMQKHEAPDFIFQVEDRLIGVEHTEVYLDKDHPMQAEESIENDIAAKAQLYANSKGYIPTRTKVLFGNVRGIKQKQRSEIAYKLADFVQFNILKSRKKPFAQIKLESNDPVISTIYARVMSNDFNNHYFAARAGWMKTDASVEIAKAVKDKSIKVTNYLKKCDEVWLLIVADGFSPSSFLGEGGNICPIESLAGFKKIYFMTYAAKKLVEVSTK